MLLGKWIMNEFNSNHLSIAHDFSRGFFEGNRMQPLQRFFTCLGGHIFYSINKWIPTCVGMGE